ncbi:aminopeptidase P N-terminal domain-containing protein [Bacteroidota bacterium]
MRYSKIDTELFSRNREKLIGKLEKKSVAIIHSNDQMVRSGDQYYPYRQNSDMFYLSGIEQEMSILLICSDPESADKMEMLFIRKPDPKLETWEGRKLDLKVAEEISGIKNVHWLENFEAISRELILESRNIYFNIPEYEKFKPEYPSRDERKMIQLKKDYPSHVFMGLAPLMTELRLVKEPGELNLIRKAVEITRAGFNRVLGYLKPGLMEFEVEAELSHEFIRQGCAGHAYPPIIASGENACMLHYIKNDMVCRDGELLLMDFGAEYANYAADCSRTIPVNGKFSRRQRELYDANLRVFKGARSLMEPGTTIDIINEKVGLLWEEEHVKLGLYTSADVRKQTKEDPLYKKYFMHGTAHFMGLDVHDLGSKQVELKPGMVLTCEPGIYIPEEKTGIRLENDILITESGHVDLMEEFPIEAEEIEELMQSRR